MKKWQQLRSKIVFDTPFFNIRMDACRLPNGREVDDYYVMQSADIVLVVAVTPQGDMIFVEQYKHGIGQVCMELPAGFCEAESAHVLDDAKRELQEETGYIAETWHKLATFVHNPTRCNNRAHVFLALDAVAEGQQNFDPNEDITVHLVSQEDILPAIRSGKVNVPDSISGVMLALDWLANHGKRDES